MEFFLKDSIFIILKTFPQFIKSFHHTENSSSFPVQGGVRGGSH